MKNKKSKTIKTYSTEKIGEAAALASKGFYPICVYSEDMRDVWYWFRIEEGLAGAIKKYRSNTLEIDKEHFLKKYLELVDWLNLNGNMELERLKDDPAEITKGS
jgi:hypothetical protein